MQDGEKVYYVINKTTGRRVSKFYSKLGLAKNFVKKFPKESQKEFEAITMFCTNYSDNLWVRIGKGFGGLIPRESSTFNTSPGDYHCTLVLEDQNLNKIRLETVEIIESRYENQNSQVQ